MGKRLTLVCIFILGIFFIALPTYAGVQNVKIGGDVTVRSLFRVNYNLDKTGDPVTNPTPKGETFSMESVGLNVGADLTDNVNTTVRLIQQRDLDNNSSTVNTFPVNLDLAYVTLKEFFWAPLTVDIGRQHLWYGKGMVVGTKLMDFNAAITAKEYTETSAFDAVKATFDLNPWTVGLAYSKVDENAVGQKNDDVDLYVANIGYKFSENNGEAEWYAITKIDGAPRLNAFPTAATETTVEKNKVYTFGARGSMDVPENILKNANLAGEVAHQIGTYNQTLNHAFDRTRDAWAVDFSGNKAFPNIMWKPKLDLEYVMFTGEKTFANGDAGKWHAWDPVYRGSFYTAIREFQNYYYATAFRAYNVANTEVDMDSGLTNTKQILFTGSIKPTEKLALKGVYTKFWLDKKLQDPTTYERRSQDMGQELDWVLTYNYSHDVSMGLLVGNFFPGSYWPKGQKNVATDVVGTVKLTF